MKKFILIFGITMMANIVMLAQTELKDGKSLMKAYVSPLGYSLGAALNNGWYNTAKPHHLGGFDVTITANLVLVPSEAKTFNVDESNGNTFKGGNTTTILGNKSEEQATSVYGTIDMPDGINIPLLPVPVLQAGVGLIKNTEIDVRYMPEIESKGVSSKLFGVGLKHDILQWLPIVDKIPVDVSIQAGYTKLSSSFEIKDATGTVAPVQANMDVSATTINLLVSKKLLMLTPYFGVGYNSTKTSFNVEGSEGYKIAGYPIPAEKLTSIELESNNNLRLNVGFRFQIAIMAIQANYTFSEYPVATVGIGVSVR
jgi:hypothetical protein